MHKVSENRIDTSVLVTGLIIPVLKYSHSTTDVSHYMVLCGIIVTFGNILLYVANEKNENSDLFPEWSKLEKKKN